MIKEVDIYRILKKERFSDYHARVLADQMSIKGNLATKDELYEVKDELKRDITDVKDELKRDIGIVRAELYDVKDELKRDIADVKDELKKDINSVRTELYTVKDELKDRINVIGMGLEKMNRKQLWTTFILVITIIAVNPKSVEMVLKAIGIIK